MLLTTAGRCERLPLKEARLTVDIGGYQYRGWFVLYKLAKYDLILGKNWMEEVPHHVDLQKNVLWLGQDTAGGKFRNRLAGLPKDAGRKDWQPEALSYQAEHTGPSKRRFNRQLPEIANFMVAEITDEATYQDDCARTWQRVFGKDCNAELQEADLEKMPEFERRIRAQYPDVFKEPTGLPPVRKDGGFRIRTIPGAEPPHRSPYRLTPDEWETYKEKTQALLTKRLIRKSNSPYAAPVIFVPHVTHTDGGWPSGSHRGRKAGSHTESHQLGASSVGFGVVWRSSLSGDIHSRNDTSFRGREAADSSR